MATKDQIIDTLIGIIMGGRGQGAIDQGNNPWLNDAGWDLPTLGQAIAKDKAARSKPKRTASRSQKKYGRAFKRLAPKYKKKNGSWKKDGFKRCVRAAHRECRRR